MDITFKTAKLLKKAGYQSADGKSQYRKNGQTWHTNVEGGISGKEKTFNIISQEEAAEWLRAEKKLHVTTEYNQGGLAMRSGYNFYIQDVECSRRRWRGECFKHNTHHKAFEEGLQSALVNFSSK